MSKYLSKDYRRIHGTLITLLFFVLIAVVSPQQLMVNLTKLCLAGCAGILGYWLDRLIFPYGSPFDLKEVAERPKATAEHKALYIQAFNNASLRRAIIVAGAIVGVCLGL